MGFSIDGLAFSTSYWYDVDLEELEARFGRDAMERIHVHTALFEVNKLASLRPTRLDMGVYGRFLTPALADLWRAVYRGVWAQWRYENNLPNETGPILSPTGATGERITLTPGDVEVLAFCGGGKDSLVAMRLLEDAGIPYAAFCYAHTVYGQLDRQHRLIGRLLDASSPVRIHRQWVFDDFLDSPVLRFHPEFDVATLTAAETPSSVFASLPVVLARGYRYVALAHERSANMGNLIWDGEEVNHQWGKSFEAERLLNTYIQEHLVAGFAYFSLLQPVHDVTIFRLLAGALDAVPATHSCNVEKPWCKRCPKCAYVWINSMAHLPTALVDQVFDGTNLLDLPENQWSFRQMLGLADQTPFECIGQVEETRLAFELCRRKGLAGAAMDTYVAEVGTTDVDAVLAAFGGVHDEHNIPPAIEERVLPLLRAAARRPVAAQR